MAAGATVVTYNGVVFNNVLTRSYRQEPVFDQSGQSVQYHRHTIRITGYVHAEYNATTQTVYTTPISTTGAANGMRKIRHLLMQPRQPFVMTCGAESLLSANPASMANPVPPPSSVNMSNCDVNNGPRCLDVTIVNITGNQIFRVDAEFEICKVECAESGFDANTTLVLSNCWSCTDDVDRNFMTRRTIQGTLRTATSLINPHAFRNFVMPPLQPGMRRDSMQFVATEDGLNLNYSIIDQEVVFAPPKPATTWSMRHTEGVSRANGALVSTVSVEVTLGGDRNVDKNQLISLASAIIDAKIGGNNGKTKRIKDSFEITNEVGDDISLIHATCTARRTPDRQLAVIAGVQVDKLKPIDAADLALVGAIVGQYDPTLSRGSRAGEQLEAHGPIPLVAAFSAYLQSPCSSDHEIYKQALTPDPGSPPTGSTANVSAYTTDAIAGDDSLSWTTDDAADLVYTFYQLETTFERSGMRAHMPVAGSSLASYVSLGGAAVSGATSVIIDLAPILVQRVVRMSAERVGEPPKFPMPKDTFADGSTNYTFLDGKMMSAAPERDPDGNQVFRETREYRYAADRDPFVENTGTYQRIGQAVNDVAGIYHRLFGSDEWNEAP